MNIIKLAKGDKFYPNKLKEIYDTLTGIQMGRLPAPEGWVYTIN